MHSHALSPAVSVCVHSCTAGRADQTQWETVHQTNLSAWSVAVMVGSCMAVVVRDEWR